MLCAEVSVTPGCYHMWWVCDFVNSLHVRQICQHAKLKPFDRLRPKCWWCFSGISEQSFWAQLFYIYIYIYFGLNCSRGVVPDLGDNVPSKQTEFSRRAWRAGLRKLWSRAIHSAFVLGLALRSTVSRASVSFLLPPSFFVTYFSVARSPKILNPP